MRKGWAVRITGNMTLCVVDSAGMRIAKVDMLRDKTMKAGTDGERLARRLNDLHIIAQIPKLSGASLGQIDVPFIDAEISRFPWQLEANEEKRTIKIMDFGMSTIAVNKFGKSVQIDLFEDIVNLLSRGIVLLNEKRGIIIGGRVSAMAKLDS